MKNKSAFWIGLLTLCLCVIVSTPALAADISHNGLCGDNLSWTLNSEGVLTFSGSGDIVSNFNDIDREWLTYSTEIKTVIIESGITAICDNAFADCSNLAAVTIPATVKTIGYQAFQNCSSLETLTIPEGVVSFGNYAFSGCSNLSTVSLPTTISEISSGAFSRCTSLQSFVVPENVKTISVFAFDRCANLSSISLSEGLEMIGHHAFARCNSLNEITFPASLKTIDYPILNGSAIANIYVNENSTRYKSVDGILFNKDLSTLICYPPARSGSYVIPDSVTRIDGSAFESCETLEEITIPATVTSIGSYAFWGCTGLSSIEIPQGVTLLNDRTFYECSNLSNVRLPEGLSVIGPSVFDGCSSLASIALPDSVTQIGYRAFMNCEALTSVVIPEKVTRIEEETFRFCSNLSNVTLPEGITTIGKNAFGDCSSMATISLPSTVSTIREYAFQGAGLTSLGVTEGTKTIGEYAFFSCKSLAEIEIPSSVTKIYNGAFNACSKLEKIYYVGTLVGWRSIYDSTDLDSKLVCEAGEVVSGNLTDDILWTLDADGLLKITGSGAMPNYTQFNAKERPWHNYVSAIKNIEIGDGITHIGDYSFWTHTALQSVTLSDSVKSIGEAAFAFSGKLTEVSVSNTLETVGDNAFLYCSKLTSFDFVDSVTSIGQDAFNHCSLTQVTIPAKTTDIRSGAFAYNPLLAAIEVDAGNVNYCSVDGVLFNHEKTELLCYPNNKNGSQYSIPQTVTTIADYAFMYCEQLEKVTLPDGLLYIGSEEGEGAFYGCSGLTTIEFPDSLRLIGGGAFAECTELNNLILPSGVKIGHHAFSECESLTNIVIPDDVTDIGANAFIGCLSLVEIELPPDIRKIETGLFYSCVKLESITIPSKVESIGRDAFFDCTALTSITIPASVKSIGANAFMSCDALETITIGDGVKSIGNYAFAGSGLRNITLPATVENLGQNAFEDCESIDRITILNPTCNIKLPQNIVETVEIHGDSESSAQTMANEYSYAFTSHNYVVDNTSNTKTCTICGVTQPLYTTQWWHFHVNNGYFKSEFDLRNNLLDGVTNITAYAEDGPRLWDTHGFRVRTDASAEGRASVLEYEAEIVSNLYNPGYRFIGWNTEPDGGGTDYNIGEIPTNLPTCYLYAQWEATGDPYVVFSTVGGEFSKNLDADGTVYAVLAEDGVAAPSVAREDFLFVGWAPKALGSMVAHDDNVWNHELYLTGDIVTTDATLTLYANWMDNSSSEKAIVYHSNGEGAVFESGTTVIANYTETTSCCTALPTREGYTLKGWNTSADGTGTAFALKSVIDVNEVFGSGPIIVNLYAQWQKNDVSGGDSGNTSGGGSSSGSSGGGFSGGSSSDSSSNVTKNPDGSTTTSTIDKATGTVTEVTKNTDGSSNIVETTKDGTVTETNKAANGTIGTVVTDKNGTVTEVKSTVSAKAVTEATKNGEAVTLPVEVPTAKTTAEAPAIQVTMPKNAASVKVEIPVEEVTPGTVAIIVKADGTEEIIKTSVPTENGVALTLNSSATVKVIDNAKVFSDTNGHWAEMAIDFVTARELFAGTTTTTFTPNSPMTRAQLMTVLARFDDEDTTGGSVWYEKGMAWAKANGVSDGSNPNGSITREQLATMLWRYSGSPIVEGSIDTFNDAGKVSGYATDAMRWAVKTGLIGGVGNNTLAPQGNATRAQLATILMRYCTNLAE